MRKSLFIALLAASHAAIFGAGWRGAVASQSPPDTPVARKTATVQDQPAVSAVERQGIAVPPPAAPRNSSEPERDDSEFRRLKIIFGDSQIKFLDVEGTLSGAAAMILQLTREERRNCDMEITRFSDALFKLQKSGLTVKEHSDQKQTYLIADFSKDAEIELQKTRAALESTLGRERAAALLDGIEKNHRNQFFDFGRGTTQVSFEESDGRFSVHEQQLNEQGQAYISNQFQTKELPIRYRRLFTVGGLPGK